MIVAGIDPGFSGGITAVKSEPGKMTTHVESIVMPIIGESKSQTVNVKALMDFLYEQKVDIVFLEKVSSRPDQSISSMFNFGYNYGKVEGAILAMNIPLRLVIPQEWMRKVLRGVPKVGKPSQPFCARMFPHVDWRAGPRCRVPHDGKTDSCCIALYGVNELVGTNAL